MLSNILCEQIFSVEVARNVSEKRICQLQLSINND